MFSFYQFPFYPFLYRIHNFKVAIIFCVLSIIQKKDGSEVSSKAKQRTNPAMGLPPPPGGVKIAPPPAKTPTSSPAHKPPQSQSQGTAGSEWGEFASASQAASAPAPTVTNASWVQF